MTRYTDNYLLDLYEDSDKPNLRDQYNSSMSKLDSALDHMHDDLVIVTDLANNAKEAADGAVGDISAIDGRLDTLEDTTIPGIQNDISGLDGRLDTLEDTTIPGIQNDVSGLDGRLDTLEDTTIPGIQNDIDTINNTTIPAIEDEISHISTGSFVPVDRNYSGTNIVWFGDSYSEPGIENSVDAYMPRRVASSLGATLFNYAVAGAGWGRAGHLISSQQTTCDNDMSAEDKNNTSVVVAMAGVNDLLNSVTASDIKDGITAFYRWASPKFPNAQIIVIPFAFGFGDLNYSYRKTIESVMNQICLINVPSVKIVPFAWAVNLGLTTRFRNQVHPNQTGYQHLASLVMQAITGGQVVTMLGGNTHDLSGNSALANGEFNWFVENGIVYCHGFARPANDGAQNVTVWAEGNCPPLLTPTEAAVTFAAYTTTSLKSPMIVDIRKTAEVTFRFPTDADHERTYWFEAAFPAQVGISWSDAQ